MSDKGNNNQIDLAGHHLFLLEVGDFVLESDHPRYFNIRMTELIQLEIQDLPVDKKFIFYDGTLPNKRDLIAVKLILERTSKTTVILTVEESSHLEKWNIDSMMMKYFDSRRESLCEREISAGDLQILKEYDDDVSFLLQYCINLEGKPLRSALRYASSIIKTSNMIARKMQESALELYNH